MYQPQLSEIVVLQWVSLLGWVPFLIVLLTAIRTLSYLRASVAIRTLSYGLFLNVGARGLAMASGFLPFPPLSRISLSLVFHLAFTVSWILIAVGLTRILAQHQQLQESLIVEIPDAT